MRLLHPFFVALSLLSVDVWAAEDASRVKHDYQVCLPIQPNS